MRPRKQTFALEFPFNSSGSYLEVPMTMTASDVWIFILHYEWITSLLYREVDKLKRAAAATEEAKPSPSDEGRRSVWTPS